MLNGIRRQLSYIYLTQIDFRGELIIIPKSGGEIRIYILEIFTVRILLLKTKNELIGRVDDFILIYNFITFKRENTRLIQ